MGNSLLFYSHCKKEKEWLYLEESWYAYYLSNYHSRILWNYGDVLAESASPAILQWAIEGAVGFARNGYRLAIPERVAIATEEYQAREDWISNFIAERCVNGDRVGGGELYAAYREWANGAGEFVRRQSDFVAAMESAGYKNLQVMGVIIGWA